MPKKIAIDDSHGQTSEVGYGRPFLTDYGLEVDGTIFANEENPQHPANRVIYNLKNGIPQQASIDFSGAYDVGEVPDGITVFINGNPIEGPAAVIQNWTLRAMAICKSGADGNTATEAVFSSKSIAPRKITTLNGSATQFDASENHKALSHAESLIKAGHYIEPDGWTVPTTDVENAYIEKHGMAQFGLWHLGTKSDVKPDLKGHWAYIYTSDFKTVDRAGLRAIASRGGQAGDDDISKAASRMIEEIDKHKANLKVTMNTNTQLAEEVKEPGDAAPKVDPDDSDKRVCAECDGEDFTKDGKCTKCEEMAKKASEEAVKKDVKEELTQTNLTPEAKAVEGADNKSQMTVEAKAVETKFAEQVQTMTKTIETLQKQNDELVAKLALANKGVSPIKGVTTEIKPVTNFSQAIQEMLTLNPSLSERPNELYEATKKKYPQFAVKPAVKH